MKHNNNEMKHWLPTRLNPLKCTSLHTMEGNEERGASHIQTPPTLTLWFVEEEEAGFPPFTCLAAVHRWHTVAVHPKSPHGKR